MNRLRCLVIISLICGSFSNHAKAQFERLVNEVSCISSTSFTSTFQYHINTENTVIFIPPTGPQAEQNGCTYMGLTSLPTGEFEIKLNCNIQPAQTKSYFNRPFVVYLRTIDKKTRVETTDRITLFSRGFYSPQCETTSIEKLDCKEIRIDTPPKPFSKVAVRSQKNTNACYAAVASSIYDYMRVLDGQSVEDPTSTLGTAMDYKKQLEFPQGRGPKGLEGGLLLAPLEGLLRIGSCTHSQIAKNLKLANLNEDELNEIYSLFTLGVSQFDVKRINECLRDFKNDFTNEAKAFVPQCNPKSFLHQVDSVAKVNPELLCLNTMGFFQDVLPLQCKESERKKISRKWKTHYFSMIHDPNYPKATLIRELDAKLLKSPHPHPVAVGIPSCTFSYSAKKHGSFSEYLKQDDCKSEFHATLVVGQWWNERKNRCEVVLRNSEGPYYHGYYGDLSNLDPSGTVGMDKKLFLEAINAILTISN